MFVIDTMSRKPVYEQLINQMERYVLTGDFKPGQPLPSVRSMSVQLSVNPNTIQKAYSELERRGFITIVPGRGCFVSEKTDYLFELIKARQMTLLETAVRDLALAGVSELELLEAVKVIHSQNRGGQINDKG